MCHLKSLFYIMNKWISIYNLNLRRLITMLFCKMARWYGIGISYFKLPGNTIYQDLKRSTVKQVLGCQVMSFTVFLPENPRLGSPQGTADSWDNFREGKSSLQQAKIVLTPSLDILGNPAAPDALASVSPDSPQWSLLELLQRWII